MSEFIQNLLAERDDLVKAKVDYSCLEAVIEANKTKIKELLAIDPKKIVNIRPTHGALPKQKGSEVLA